MKKLGSFIVLLVLVLAMTAIVANAEDTYKFAVPCALTGDSAQFGEPIKLAVKLATDEINAAGGINGKPMEVTLFDDKNDPTEAASVAARIVAEGDFFAVIGHHSSGATLAAAPHYERAGLVYLSASNSRDDLSEQGFQYFFRTMTKDSDNAPALANIAMDQLCAKKIAVMYTNNDWGVSFKDSIIDTVTARGGEVVASETYRAGDRDFSSQLAKIASYEPDALILIVEYTEAALICIQKQNTSIADIPVISSSNADVPDFLEIGGKGVEGVIIQTIWDRWNQGSSQKSFNQKWYDNFGVPAYDTAAYYYDALYLMKYAIENGATRDTLADFLHQVEYEGVAGTIKFSPNGDSDGKFVYAVTVKDGEFTSYDLSTKAECPN